MDLNSFKASFDSPIPDDRYSLCCGNKNLVNVGMGESPPWHSSFLSNIGKDLADIHKDTLSGLANYNLTQNANALYAEDTHSREKDNLRDMYSCMRYCQNIMYSESDESRKTNLRGLTTSANNLYTRTGRYSPPTLSPNMLKLSGVTDMLKKSDQLKATTIYDTVQDLNEYEQNGIDLKGCVERLMAFIEKGIAEMEMAMLDVSDVYNIYNGAVDGIASTAAFIEDTASSIINNTFGIAKAIDGVDQAIHDFMDSGESGIGGVLNNASKLTNCAKLF